MFLLTMTRAPALVVTLDGSAGIGHKTTKTYVTEACDTQTMPKKQVTTRLDADDAEAVERYCDEKDITQAEAVRRLIREGLDERQARADGGEVISRIEEQEQVNRWRMATIVAGIMYVLAYSEGFRGPASIVFGLLIVASLIVSIWGAHVAELLEGEAHD
jgi:Ribbon-helix-helix protein, copG family.